MTDQITPDRLDLAIDANHEAEVILRNLADFISKGHDSHEAQIFTRGQISRLRALNGLVHSALAPDGDVDATERLTERLLG